MIQFNLLPDVKLEFVKAERTKHAVVSGAIIATGVSFIIFLLLFLAVHVVQQKIINDQTANIVKYSDELKNTKDLDKILTIQNQLGVLPELHAGKPAVVRTFNLIKQITPSTVSLNDVTVDYVAHTISITGAAKTLSEINTMVDTVKYANYQTEVDGDQTKVFSDVVLSSFSRSASNGTFTLTAAYDEKIFDNSVSMTFSVPGGPTTRSVVEQPQLFTKPIDESSN